MTDLLTVCINSSEMFMDFILRFRPLAIAYLFRLVGGKTKGQNTFEFESQHQVWKVVALWNRV